MTDVLRIEIAKTLLVLEREQRRLGAWETLAPDPARLASDVPFCHDTLEFTQWVQWVFLPRFRAVLEGDHRLPQASAIAPIAEDALARLDGDTDAMLDAFRSIDRLLNSQGHTR
jgi:uncharacterized protein YqcC (DUF446 family)